jgi:methyl-accepting chemotaxis protein
MAGKDRAANLTILIGVSLMSFLVVAVAVSGGLGLRQVVSRTQDILVRDAHVSEEALQAHVATLQLRRFEKDYFLNMGAPDKQGEYLIKWQNAREQLLGRLDALEKLVPSEEDRATLQSMRNDLATYLAGFDKVRGAVDSGDLKTPQAANIAVTQYKDAIHHLENLAAAIGDASDIKMGKRFALLDADTEHAKMQMGLTAALAVVVAILIGWRIRAVTRDAV